MAPPDAPARHKPKHAPRNQPQKKTTWTKLKNSAMFWLGLIFLFTILVVLGIVALAALLSGA